MTLKAMPYKKRFFLILFGGILLCMALYKKNIKELIAVNRQINEIEAKLSKVNGSFNEIYYLNTEIKQLNTIIGGQSKTPELVQQDILEFISKSQYKVNIHTVTDPHLVVDKDFNIYTNSIQIEADFNTLLQLLFYIEKNFKQSKVSSVSFFTKKNVAKNSKKLFLKLILQNYENKN